MNPSVNDFSLVAHYSEFTSVPGAGLVASKLASDARGRIPHDLTATSQQDPALSLINVMDAGYTEYLTLNLDVIRDVFHISCYPLVSASKQVLGESASAIGNGPAQWENLQAQTTS